MPLKALKPCCQAGCPALTRERYCPDHARQEQQRCDANRGTSTQRGYNERWKKARITYLKRHPLCVECERAGRLVPATVVDHIKPHKGDSAVFWDTSNWQSLCKRCHDRKTAKEDGGFGNGPSSRGKC